MKHGMHMKDYAAGGSDWSRAGSKSKANGPYGPGGIQAAYGNPNSYAMLNDTPGGPYSHALGYSGDGGMYGDASVDHRGSKFWFK